MRSVVVCHKMMIAVVIVLLAGSCAAYHYEVKRFTVPVDHFSFDNSDTFTIRYLVNNSYWDQKRGSIFFYTGNEGDIEMFANNSGFIWESAPDFKALIIFAEHRYYGDSLPYGNKSFSDPKYLGYLTSQQALADYVDLIQHIKSKQLSRPFNRQNPVIAFGGSYGGMLAAWIRMKYPHIVSGAIAASAPILQFPGLVPCEAFYRIVTSDFSSESKECSNTIRKSWDIIRKLSKTDEGRKWLSTNWTLCKPLQSEADADLLMSWLTDVYTNLAMLDYPYATNFLLPLPAYPIKTMCSKLYNSSLPDKPLLQMLFSGLNVYTGKEKCLNISVDASPKLGELGWDFQACTEMVMPMCSNGVTDMFDKVKWNFTSFSQSCYKKWKVYPQADLAIKTYGGKDISTASNIVFSNGLLDPWSSGGVLKNVSETAVAVLIPEGAHHLDLRGSNEADPSSVKWARRFHQRSISSWITQHYKS
ncbi:lysosomal Pro-X carboxypeptidase [Schistocerca piceifrons]|uniref:lysosomal Pro-X carboxypeptidase n=1 Tax=Schistocerca piceifrons TaxID=274613 RepID=UPI001F5E8B78|nr:lysosomal Pro-X carboxypeptidase [Schistocerca piceifrons]